jgi:hypothetical protein
MDRFIAYQEGMSIVNQASAEAGYNYYGFNRWGKDEWCIIKEKVDQSEYIYAIGVGNYSTNWTNRATLIYKTPSNW